MIQAEHISFSYENGEQIINDLSFSVAPGESVGLIGANGAGKSTMLKLLTGLLPLTQGTLRVMDMPVDKKHLREIRRSIGFVLQDADDQMFMPTVYEDMMFAPLNYGLSREEAQRRADDVLTRLSLTELKDRYNHKISVGEKRMAAIAAVLVMEPDILLMDEPTAALDPYGRRQVIRTINAMSATRLIASHDMDMIYDTCQRVLLLDHGSIVYDGPTKTVLQDQALLEAHRLELPLRFSDR